MLSLYSTELTLITLNLIVTEKNVNKDYSFCDGSFSTRVRNLLLKYSINVIYNGRVEVRLSPLGAGLFSPFLSVSSESATILAP